MRAANRLHHVSVIFMKTRLRFGPLPGSLECWWVLGRSSPKSLFNSLAQSQESHFFMNKARRIFQRSVLVEVSQLRREKGSTTAMSFHLWLMREEEGYDRVSLRHPRTEHGEHFRKKSCRHGRMSLESSQKTLFQTEKWRLLEKILGIIIRIAERVCSEQRIPLSTTHVQLSLSTRKLFCLLSAVGWSQWNVPNEIIDAFTRNLWSVHHAADRGS